LLEKDPGITGTYTVDGPVTIHSNRNEVHWPSGRNLRITDNSARNTAPRR